MEGPGLFLKYPITSDGTEYLVMWIEYNLLTEEYFILSIY